MSAALVSNLGKLPRMALQELCQVAAQHSSQLHQHNLLPSTGPSQGNPPADVLITNSHFILHPAVLPSTAQPSASCQQQSISCETPTGIAFSLPGLSQGQLQCKVKEVVKPLIFPPEAERMNRRRVWEYQWVTVDNGRVWLARREAGTKRWVLWRPIHKVIPQDVPVPAK